MLLVFLFQVSVRVHGIALMWHRSIWGGMPFLTPPLSAGNRTRDLSYESPMPYPLHHGHFPQSAYSWKLGLHLSMMVLTWWLNLRWQSNVTPRSFMVSSSVTAELFIMIGGVLTCFFNENIILFDLVALMSMLFVLHHSVANSCQE